MIPRELFTSWPVTRSRHALTKIMTATTISIIGVRKRWFCFVELFSLVLFCVLRGSLEWRWVMGGMAGWGEIILLLVFLANEYINQYITISP
jgi:hypothetical protein